MNSNQTKPKISKILKMHLPHIVISGALLLSGCSGTIHKTSALGGYSVLSIDARQRLVLSGTSPTGHRVICAEPSPDAVVARASYFSGGANVANKGSGQLAGGSSEAVGSIGLRTQTIQLLRDGYYRVCEAYLNGAIGSTEYKAILQQIDRFMVVLVAIESLGGVVAAPAITIGANSQLTITTDKAELKGDAVVDKEMVKAITASATNLTPEQAAAITDIVVAYLTHGRRVAS